MGITRHVIIGNGAAGATAAQTIRKARPDDRILLVTEESHPSYWRGLLPDYLAGRASVDDLWLYPESYYREARIDVRLGSRVVRVEPGQGALFTETGDRIMFDKLLIACGGEPKVPSIRGMAEANPLTLKTLSDAQNILARVKRGSSVAVLARDLIGVELTRAFCQMGMRATYVEWNSQLLPHIIDEATAEELAAKMEAAGVTLVIGERIIEVGVSPPGIELITPERTITADALAVAIGVAPNLDWLDGSEIARDSGIIVDERLRTNYPNIFAAGDAAEVYDPRVMRRRLLFGWKNAIEQGMVAGANMCGEMDVFERLDVAYTTDRKQIFGVDVRHRWK